MDLRKLGMSAVVEDGAFFAAVKPGLRVERQIVYELASARKVQQAGAVNVDRSNWKDATNCLVGRRRDALHGGKCVRATPVLHSINAA